MKKSDKVIILDPDGKDYRLGLYLEEWNNTASLIDITYGGMWDPEVIPNKYIKPYSDDLVDKLYKKTGIKRKFSKIF